MTTTSSIECLECTTMTTCHNDNIYISTVRARDQWWTEKWLLLRCPRRKCNLIWIKKIVYSVEVKRSLKISLRILARIVYPMEQMREIPLKDTLVCYRNNIHCIQLFFSLYLVSPNRFRHTPYIKAYIFLIFGFIGLI